MSRAVVPRTGRSSGGILPAWRRLAMSCWGSVRGSSLVLILAVSASACTGGSGLHLVRPAHPGAVHRQPAAGVTTREPGLVWAEGRVPAEVVRAVMHLIGARAVTVANGTA